MNRRILFISAVCIAAFGVLMGVRGEIGSFWLRTLIAGLAGGVLGLIIILALRAGWRS